MKYDSVFVEIYEQQESRLLLYPNPVLKTLTINKHNCAGKTCFIEIRDIRGIKLFETQIMDREIVLDIEKYPSGLYFLNMKSATSNYTMKFCKD